MAASMWRMNGLWRRMAGVLLLCALLLSDKVIGQDDAAADPSVASAADPTAGDAVAGTVAAAPDASAGPTAGAPATTAQAISRNGGGGGASAAPGDSLFPLTVRNISFDGDSQDGDASGTTAAPLGADNKAVTGGEVPNVIKMVVPEVKCVGQGDIPESNAVKAQVVTKDCEATKRIIRDNAAAWCKSDNCNLKIFQDSNTLLVASENAKLGSLADALQSENLREKLGVTQIEMPPSSGSSVFVGVLVSGLLAALAITVGYLKCPRRSDAKAVRLADEAYPADQENQGNTLVSVAPLNPPPETQEKPSVNGESPEADKTPAAPAAPPTNGTSTAKTADTEL